MSPFEPTALRPAWRGHKELAGPEPPHAGEIFGTLPEVIKPAPAIHGLESPGEAFPQTNAAPRRHADLLHSLDKPR